MVSTSIMLGYQLGWSPALTVAPSIMLDYQLGWSLTLAIAPSVMLGCQLGWSPALAGAPSIMLGYQLGWNPALAVAPSIMLGCQLGWSPALADILAPPVVVVKESEVVVGTGGGGPCLARPWRSPECEWVERWLLTPLVGATPLDMTQQEHSQYGAWLLQVRDWVHAQGNDVSALLQLKADTHRTGLCIDTSNHSVIFVGEMYAGWSSDGCSCMSECRYVWVRVCVSRGIYMSTGLVCGRSGVWLLVDLYNWYLSLPRLIQLILMSLPSLVHVLIG